MLTPISAITTAGIAPSEAGAASGLSNMLRNLGGAVGTATLATVLTKREQFHSNIIGQSVTLYRDEVRQRIAELTQLLPVARRLRPGRRAAPGDRGDRQYRQAAGAHHGLQRYLRRHRRGPGDRRRRAPFRPQDQDRRGRGGRSLTEPGRGGAALFEQARRADPPDAYLRPARASTKKFRRPRNKGAPSLFGSGAERRGG